MGPSMFERNVSGRGPRRPRPRALRWAIGFGAGLPATPGPFRHVELLTEPRSRHAKFHSAHLEVRKGPSRPSALFFQTRISTAASPKAWVRSATSASSCSSRDVGPDFPAVIPALPASRNCRFPFPIACSETYSRRPASATNTSPCKTDNTIRIFFPTGITGGLPIIFRLAFKKLDQQRTSLPPSLTRDKMRPAPHFASTLDESRRGPVASCQYLREVYDVASFGFLRQSWSFQA